VNSEESATRKDSLPVKVSTFGIDLKSPKSIKSYPFKNSIYFNFDDYIIPSKFRALLEAHAHYLIAHKNQSILVQGNTDERGGREYNLALGQKRAEAVQKVLILLGVSGNQIEAVSLGEEKPKSSGKDKSSYAENRRSDLVYQK
jgi:peptidoglycan-associated lipoprotein